MGTRRLVTLAVLSAFLTACRGQAEPSPEQHTEEMTLLAAPATRATGEATASAQQTPLPSGEAQPAEELLEERPVHFTPRRDGDGYLYRSFIQLPEGTTWGPDGHLYVADWGGRHVVRVAPDGTMEDIGLWQYGQWQSYSGPRFVAFDSSGSLYVSDRGGIFKVDDGGTMNRVPGAQAPSGNLAGIAFSPSDELYFADQDRGSIRRVTADGDSEAVATDIPGAYDMVFAPDGALYVSQMRRDNVVKVDVETGEVNDFFSFSAQLSGCCPSYLAIDGDGDVWIRGDLALFQVAPDGTPKPFTLNGETYSGYVGHLKAPADIAFDDQGQLWVASVESFIWRIDRTASEQDFDGGSVNVIVPGFFASDIDVGADGTVYVYRINTSPGELWSISPDGKTEVLTQIDEPEVGLAVDDQGNIYLGRPSGEISAFTPDGVLAHYAWLNTWRMTVGTDGYLYAVVGSWGEHKTVVRVTGVDEYELVVSEIEGSPLGPGDVGIDAAPNGGLYLYDPTNRRIVYVDSKGQGSAFSAPQSGASIAATAVSPSGNVFIVPHGLYEVLRFDPNEGLIRTYARGLVGDPWGLAISPDGQWLYVAESGVIDKIPLEETE